MTAAASKTPIANRERLDVFYPILPDARWIERLVPLGIRTVQLRLKDADPEDVERQIAASLAVCRANDCQLIVNDHWREALAMGADYIHLGQEDLASADLAAIRRGGLRLGLSTHSPEELETALAASPDYVALGPIFETRLKAMKWAPQGLERLGAWRQRIGVLELVAIAGLTPQRASAALKAGADSAAVITDFMAAPDPVERVKSWLAWAAGERRTPPGH
ncbi:MAG: thiamine phosphate synthase [Hyphomicrobiaceae bacterium]|nr:thiamine phosphate synthase [Hyphomicrobiaceae bacterium]